MTSKRFSSFSISFSPRDVLRHQLLSFSHASDWLKCNPSKSLCLGFSAPEFRMLLKYRLGMPVSPSGKCFQCDKRSSDGSFILGDHALCCIRSGLVRRHYDIVHEICSILSQSCRVVKTEYAVQNSPQLRADLVASKSLTSPETAFDVTIVHALSNAQGTSAMAKREVEKTEKYKAACEKIGLSFSPLAFDSHGGMGLLRLRLSRRLSLQLHRSTRI